MHTEGEPLFQDALTEGRTSPKPKVESGKFQGQLYKEIGRDQPIEELGVRQRSFLERARQCRLEAWGKHCQGQGARTMPRV